jgi:GNAT superfamily N-acetyltransferase
MAATATAIAYRRVGAGYCERAILADGTSVALRSIRQSDAPLLQDALLRLSPRSRFLRFHAPRGPFSEEELRRLTDVDGETHFAIAAFARPARSLIAVARFLRESVSAPHAEMALAVVDAFQRKGLGRLLLSRLREAAAERNVAVLTGPMLDENQPMRGLLRQSGARIGVARRGVCDIELALT